MAIVNAMAGIMVDDLDAALSWYEKILERPPDARPMDGLAEWELPGGAWIQVYRDVDRAGRSSVTFVVTGFEAHLEQLKAKAVPVDETTTSDYVKTATVRDPCGNRVVFAELLGHH